MVDKARKYHVLLIGVDHYQDHALGGCVNDIDAVQRVLLGERMAIPRSCIRRLASPVPGTQHETAIPEQPATRDNVLAALADLASNDEVADGDRVFIYYSGHGSRLDNSSVTAAPGERPLFQRETIVASDPETGEPQYVWDFELNEVLQDIVDRTRSVSVVLDCCFGAGVTRTARIEDRDGTWADRYLDPSPGDRALPPGAPATRTRKASANGRARRPVSDCHVVAACTGHQTAKETTRDGVRHGLLTRAFIRALEAADADLATLRWNRIWQAMVAEIDEWNPLQQPWMAGNRAREVFGGPPVNDDPGFDVTRTEDGYRIEAGTLADVTRGAVLAIYGDKPKTFGDLNSEQDRAARIGRLRVTEAQADHATANVVGPGFELPPGARARIIEAGEAAPLRVSVSPSNKQLEAKLGASPLLAIARRSTRADVWLEQVGKQWFVTDDVHGTGVDGPVLFALHDEELVHARKVLEHYYRYSRPLRVAKRATDLSGSLELKVLACPPKVPPYVAQAADFPEATRTRRTNYELNPGQTICFWVRNGSEYPLNVTLVNVAASGRVQMLGTQVIDRNEFKSFWAGEGLGSAFFMKAPAPGLSCIDRVLAIGTTNMRHDLRYLRVDQGFAGLVPRTRSDAKDFGGTEQRGAASPVDKWTAAQVIIETRRR